MVDEIKKAVEDWGQSDNPFDVTVKRTSKFLPTLKDGDSRVIRFLVETDATKGFMKKFRHRWVEGADGQSKGDFTCLNSRENLKKGIVCPLCEKGLNATARFLTLVIDREDNQVKILEQGRMLYDQLTEYAKANDTITNIDFDYSRKGKSQFDTKYGISPIIKTVGELTQKETALREAADIDLSKIVAEKTREELLTIISGEEKKREAVEEKGDVLPF